MLNTFDDQLLDLWFIFPFSRKHPSPLQRQFYACGRVLRLGPWPFRDGVPDSWNPARRDGEAV